jgi:4-diphosphocytidyl-2-C-methyl-D-erythritol kinase
VRVSAPAKLNLFLHVGERRDDGYHALESLIAFTEVADCIKIAPASELEVLATGRFSRALPHKHDNLVFKAARALQRHMQVSHGATIMVEKNLPIAGGIGGGSADAAAVLRGLDLLWELHTPVKQLVALAADLGSDVPVCLLSQPCWVQGRGEVLTPIPPLPRLSTVLVNPGVALPTPHVFAALNARTGTGSMHPPGKLKTLWDVLEFLGDATNDLEAPACQIAPAIQDVLTAFDQEPGCALAQMSGSGSTCFALFHEHEFAQGAAERIAQDHPGWWVALTRIAGLEAGAAEWIG